MSTAKTREQMLDETKEYLDDIKDLQQKILKALKTLEGNQSKRTGKHSSVVSKEVEQPPGIPSLKDKGHLRPLPLVKTSPVVTSSRQGTESEGDVVSKAQSSGRTKGKARETTVDTSQTVSGASASHKEDESDSGTTSAISGHKIQKHKGILKTADNGTEFSYGFQERFDLEEKHIVYGNGLKRRKVDLFQDNRLSEQFDIPPDTGHVYEKRRTAVDTANKSTKPKAQASSGGHSKIPNKHSGERPPGLSIEPKPVKATMSVKKTSGQHVGRGQSGHGITSKPKQPVAERVHKSDQTKSTDKGRSPPDQRRQPIKDADQERQPTRSSDQGRSLTKHSSPVQAKKHPEKSVTSRPSLQTQDTQVVTTVEAQTRQLTSKFLTTLEEGNLESTKNFLGQMESLAKFSHEFTDTSVDLNELMTNSGLTPEKHKEMLLEQFKQLGMPVDEEEVSRQVEMMLDENGHWNRDKMHQTSMNGLDQMKTALADLEEADRDTEPSPTEANQQTRAIEWQECSTKAVAEPETVQEPVHIEATLWTQYAAEEIERGRVAQDVRETGMDTIFLLDLSASMRGSPWQQAMTFINDFVECVQNTTLMDNNYEHIALVTFGSETRVQQHLTCDYLEINRKLERLSPAGPSPLQAGIHMVHAAIEGAGMVFRMHGYKIPPRVFLITDGKATPYTMIAGPEAMDGHTLKQDKIGLLELVKKLHKDYQSVRIFPVPVGNADMTLLEDIAKLTEGRVVSPDDAEIFSAVFKNYKRAAAMGQLFPDPDVAMGMLGAMSDVDRAQCLEFLSTFKRASDDSDDEEDDLPPLGSRVQELAAGTNIMAQADTPLGTVTRHWTDGHIGVTWDRDHPQRKTLRSKVLYNKLGTKEVVPSDKPRVLDGEMIAIGCKVKRGRDWKYSDQDGGKGSIGSVYKVEDDGSVKVRWDSNCCKNSYRFGSMDKFDVEVVDQPASKQELLEDDEDQIEEMNKRNQQNLRNNARNAGNVATLEVANGNEVKTDQSEENRRRAHASHSGRRSRQTDPNRNRASPPSGASREGNMASSISAQTDRKSTRPKTHTRSQQSVKNVAWLWLDEGTDVWQPYPDDINQHMENSYQANPKGTMLIHLQDKPHRVTFSRMEMIDTGTRKRYKLTRRTGP